MKLPVMSGDAAGSMLSADAVSRAVPATSYRSSGAEIAPEEHRYSVFVERKFASYEALILWNPESSGRTIRLKRALLCDAQGPRSWDTTPCAVDIYRFIPGFLSPPYSWEGTSIAVERMSTASPASIVQAAVDSWVTAGVNHIQSVLAMKESSGWRAGSSRWIDFTRNGSDG